MILNSNLIDRFENDFDFDTLYDQESPQLYPNTLLDGWGIESKESLFNFLHESKKVKTIRIQNSPISFFTFIIGLGTLAFTIAFSNRMFVRNRHISTAGVEHAIGTSRGMEMERVQFGDSTRALVGRPRNGSMMAKMVKTHYALPQRPKSYPPLFAHAVPQFEQLAQVEKSGRTQTFLANRIEDLEGKSRSSNDEYILAIAQQALNDEKIAFYYMTARWHTLDQIGFSHIKNEIPTISHEMLHEIEEQHKITKARAERSLEKFNLVCSNQDQLLSFYIPFVWLALDFI